MTTLAQDDFEIRDEGNPQPITLFDNSPQPIRLVVMLDVSGSMEGNLGLLRQPRSNCSRACARTTWCGLARLGTTSISVRSFTRNTDELRRALPDRDRSRRADPALARD